MGRSGISSPDDVYGPLGMALSVHHGIETQTDPLRPPDEGWPSIWDAPVSGGVLVGEHPTVHLFPILRPRDEP